MDWRWWSCLIVLSWELLKTAFALVCLCCWRMWVRHWILPSNLCCLNRHIHQLVVSFFFHWEFRHVISVAISEQHFILVLSEFSWYLGILLWCLNFSAVLKKAKQDNAVLLSTSFCERFIFYNCLHINWQEGVPCLFLWLWCVVWYVYAEKNGLIITSRLLLYHGGCWHNCIMGSL